MPAKDRIHDAVRNALVKDGWTITADPYSLTIGTVTVQADLAAERVIAAERGADRIAVEIKSFLGPSPISDLEKALGQYQVYRIFMDRLDRDRKLYLAIDERTRDRIFSRDVVQMIVENAQLPYLVIRTRAEEVIEWHG